MSSRRLWGGSSRRLSALFLVVVLPPAATLVWLGLQLVEQDRSLWAQRELEGRQAAAEAIVCGYVSFCVQKRLRKTSGHGKG